MPAPTLALSIVSHGQGPLVGALLDDLQAYWKPDWDVIVTINIPEDESYLLGRAFPIRLLRNESPKGFGANHNQAFRSTPAPLFAVLNPDLRLPHFDVAPLLRLMDSSRFAACAPLVRNADGQVEDSARRFPSLARIASRVWLRLRGLRPQSDYRLKAGSGVHLVDWVAGMFVVFRSDAYAAVKGFDERFFMYLEDADICQRLWLYGCAIAVCTDTEVVHDARRATLRSLRHLRWHVKSLLRYLALSAGRPARPKGADS